MRAALYIPEHQNVADQKLSNYSNNRDGTLWVSPIEAEGKRKKSQRGMRKFKGKACEGVVLDVSEGWQQLNAPLSPTILISF